MKIISRSNYVLLALLVAFSFSCSKGEQGIAGQNGNANVISEWFQLSLDYVDPSGESGYMVIDTPEIQDFITNGGLVMMYVKGHSEDSTTMEIRPLPYGDGLFDFGVFNIPESDIFNSLVLLVDWGDDVTDLENNPFFTFCYVLIPANLYIPDTKDYKNMSYEELLYELEL